MNNDLGHHWNIDGHDYKGEVEYDNDDLYKRWL